MNQNAKERRSTSELINTGRWNEALEQARADSEVPELAERVHTWFQLALIEGLHGTAEACQNARERARRCSDYSEVLEGDLLRDDAIMLLKAGHLQTARECVDHARTLHGHDLNRLICLKMIDGRIQLHDGRYNEAYETLRGAATDWKGMGEEAHHQWRVNLQLHLLMAAVMSGHGLRAWLLLPQLLRSDRNHRRWTAALTCLCGKWACKSILHRH